MGGVEKKPKWALVHGIKDAMWCFGVFDDGRTAVGDAVLRAGDEKENCTDPRFVYEFGSWDDMEGDAGIMMTVTITNTETNEKEEEYWYVMEVLDE